MNGTRKGQVISYDLMFASTVAVVLLGIVLVASNTIAGASQARYEEGSSVADMALSQLVLTPGSPSDWKELNEDMHSIGLADSRGVLDAGKIVQFIKFEQLAAAPAERDELRARLGLLREGAAYEFEFEVLSADGSRLYSTGNQPAGEGSVFVSRRVARLDGEPVFAVMKVWRK
ncbi:MAG: hypothetical protein Q7T16_01545 [Candidatus Burarchaeum sp.]|nr:hypothetical protein [Candidatus Burarchaeum sp.]